MTRYLFLRVALAAFLPAKTDKSVKDVERELLGTNDIPKVMERGLSLTNVLEVDAVLCEDVAGSLLGHFLTPVNGLPACS